MNLFLINQCFKSYDYILDLIKTDYWIDFSTYNIGPQVDFSTLSDALYHLNTHLKLRTFLAGYSVKIADLAVWGGIAYNSLCLLFHLDWISLFLHLMECSSIFCSFEVKSYFWKALQIKQQNAWSILAQMVVDILSIQRIIQIYIIPHKYTYITYT